MRTNKPKKGFTLVELSLSMVFISLLSLAIVLIIMNTISSYRRGLTMNQVNSVGSEIVDDIRVAIQNSPADSIANRCSARYDDATQRTNCINSGAINMISVAQKGTVKLNGDSGTISAYIYGAICTGKYSYIWNSGYAFSEDATADGGGSIAKAYLSVDGHEYKNFRLIKVSDENHKICTQNTGSTMNSKLVISSDEMGGVEPVELIDRNSDLALYDLNLLPPAESNDGTSLFYSGSLILGTIRGGPDIGSSGSTCKAPDSTISDVDYCAINKFKFAVQANGANGA